MHLPLDRLHLQTLFSWASSATVMWTTLWQEARREYLARTASTAPVFGGDASHLPPVLMMRPAYCGTLAAVRALGRASIPVTLADPAPYTLAGSSRYATRVLRCPPVTDSQSFLNWLHDFGEREPRHVLLPTCDDTAWLFARHRDSLSKLFHLSSSSLTAIHGLLHKGRLADHAQAVGLATATAWFPQSESALTTAMSESRFPALVKATTQAMSPARSKGKVVNRPEDLPAAFRDMLALNHDQSILDYDRSSVLPFVQEFFPDASERIYNISGYIHDGKLRGARAARKLLQRPRRLGIGLCFEEAEVDPGLLDGLVRLAERVGFSGVFEAEFIREPGRDVLIDFNPRFYNQMAFDIAQGLPLPLLAYDDALAGQTPFANAVCTTRTDNTGKLFVHGSEFRLIIAAQSLSGALTAEEAQAWRSWYEQNSGRLMDAIDDPEDPRPSYFDRMEIAFRNLRHPRSFIRSTALNR